MIILHLSFLERRFFLWGEVAPLKEPATKKKSSRKKKSDPPPPSPYDPSSEHLSDAIWEADLSFEVKETTQVVAWLPSTKKAPAPSTPLLTEEGLSVKENLVLSPWSVSAVPLSIDQAINFLADCVGKTMLAPGILVGEDVQYWSNVLRFAGALVAREQFLPGLISQDDQFSACWKPVYMGEEAGRLALLTSAMPSSCRALSKGEQPDTSASEVLTQVLDQFVDRLVRNSWIDSGGSMHTPASFPSIHDQWMHALRSPEGAMSSPWADLAHLNEQIQAWQRAISISTQTPFRLAFRLEEPDVFAGDTDTWAVRFLLQATNDPSLLVDVEKAWNPDKRTTKLFDQRRFRPHEYLLISLGQATSLFPAMEESLKKPRPAGCQIDTHQAFAFEPSTFSNRSRSTPTATSGSQP